MTSSASNRRRFWVRAGVGAVITAALLLFLLRYIDPREIGRLFATTRWPLWFAGLGCWIAIYLARAARFVLLAPRTPYLTMLSIAAVHNFLLRLLPLRTGDLSYAFLVKRAGTAGFGESLLGLLLLRILDGTVVVIIFSVTLCVDQGMYLGDRRAGLLAAAIAAAVGVAVTASLGPLLRAGLAVARGLLHATGLAARPRVAAALKKVDATVAEYGRIPAGIILRVSLATVGVWLLTFWAFFAIMRAFSMPVSVAQTVLGATAAVVTGFLPIGGIGSFGTLEAGWAVGFTLVGLDRASAVASAFGVSISTFFYAAALGLPGWIGLGVVRRHALPATRPLLPVDRNREEA